MPETFSKPGAGDVTAKEKYQLRHLLKHYCAMAHTFTACYKDQVKHGVAPDHAKRRCSVLKSLCGKSQGGKKK